MSTKSARPAELTKRSDIRFLAFQKIATVFLGVIVSSSSLAGAGDLDSTFGEEGLVTTDIGRDFNGAGVRDVFPKPDGTFIVAVQSDHLKFTRYHADGTIDSLYGVGGSVTLPVLNVPGNEISVRDVELLEDERIIMAAKGRVLSGYICELGVCRDVYTNSYFLARFNADLSPDTTFGLDGELAINFTDYFGSESHDVITHMAVQPDDKIVVIVESLVPEGGPRNRFTNIVRYTPDGVLDQSFGNGGITEFSHTTGRSRKYAWKLQLQPDGKLLIHLNDQVTHTQHLVRYNPDGSADDSFGAGGKTAHMGSIDSFTLQEDGKVVLVGTAYVFSPVRICGFGVKRINADGTTDMTFGVNGATIVDFGCNNSTRIFGIPQSVSIKPDNKIVVTGDTYWVDDNYDRRTSVAFAQLNPNGSLDNSFGSGGKMVTDFDEGALSVSSISIQSDGQILAFGELTSSPFDNDLFGLGSFYRNPIMLAYNADGTANTGFGVDGQIIISAYWATDDEAMDIVAFQADGKILVGGTSSTRFRGDFALVRYDTNGALDTTFGVDGKLTTDFTLSHEQPCEWIIHSDDQLMAITVQEDGKIVVVGRSRNGDSNWAWCENSRLNIAVARYLPDGTLDESFGTGGKAIVLQDVLDPSVMAVGTNVTVQPDGRIVLVGHDGYGYLVARLNSDGSMDESFGVGGFSTWNPSDVITGVGYYVDMTSVDLQPDGKIVTAGFFMVTGPPGSPVPSRCILFRFNQDGFLDMTFGPSGGGIVNYFYGSSICSDLEIQPDGKIVVTGSTINTDPGRTSMAQFSVHRFMPDGSDDLAFGTDGEVKSDFDLSIGPIGGDRAESIVLQADERILVGGTVANFYRDADQYVQLNKDFGVVRLNADGSHDYSFGNSGKVTTDFGSTKDSGRALAVQADGKILLAGGSSQNFKGVGEEIAVARYEGVSTKLDELDGLILRVQELHTAGILSDGRGKSLLAKLQAAVQQVDRGNFATAANQLGAFIGQVTAFVSANILTTTQGETLNSEAQRIIEFLPSE